MKPSALLLMVVLSAVVSAQKPQTGYAPVNGLRMYYEIHGKGQPVVLLHGSFMTITTNWPEMIARLSKTRQVIAVEMQGHGRTADIERDFSYENLSDDVAALLDYLKIPKADLIGYSLGGGVAMLTAIRHPDKVRKVVSISATLRDDGTKIPSYCASARLERIAYWLSISSTAYESSLGGAIGRPYPMKTAFTDGKEVRYAAAGIYELSWGIPSEAHGALNLAVERVHSDDVEREGHPLVRHQRSGAE